MKRIRFVVCIVFLVALAGCAKKENPYDFDEIPQDTTTIEQITSSIDTTQSTTEPKKLTEGLSMKYSTAGGAMAEKLGVDKTLVFVTYDLMVGYVDPIVYERFNELLVNKYGCDFVVEFRGYNFVGDKNEKLYQEEIREMRELGVQTDILCVGQNVTIGEDTYANAINDGLLEPLGEWFETNWGKILKKSYPDIYWERLLRDGECYGKALEYIIDNPIVILINNEYVKKIEDAKNIKTVEDVVNFLEKVGEDEEDIIPLAVNSNTAFNVINGYYDFKYGDWLGLSTTSNGAGIYARNTNGKWEAFFSLEDEEYTNALMKIRNYGGDSEFSHDEAIQLGKFVVAITRLHMDVFNNETLKVVDKLKNGSTINMDVTVGNVTEGWYEYLDGNAIGIASWSEYKEEALQLLALMSSEPELSNLLAYGLEGIHYELVDGVVKRGDKFADVAMLWSVSMANPIITHPVGLETTDKEQRYNELASKAQLGLDSLYDIDVSKYKEILTEMAKVMTEYDGWLYKDNYMELLNEQRSKMKELGIDEVVAEINRQLEEAQK